MSRMKWRRRGRRWTKTTKTTTTTKKKTIVPHEDDDDDDEVAVVVVDRDFHRTDLVDPVEEDKNERVDSSRPLRLW